MDDRADATEITDEEIDRLIAEVTDECDIGDANDYDVVSEFDDVIMAADSSKVESLTVKDDAKEEKPKEDKVGAEKSAASGNVKTKQVESTTKKDNGAPQTASNEKEPESKLKDEILPVAITEAPSMKEKGADRSKATISPVSVFDDRLTAVDSAKVESVTVKDDAKEEKPKEDKVGAEKSADSGNVKTKQVKSTTEKDNGAPQTASNEKEPESKQKDEISPVAITETPSMKEKGADRSKATVSPRTTGKPLGGKEAGNAGKKEESPVASGKKPGGKEAGNKDVKKASTKVIEQNVGEKEMGSKSKLPEKTSKAPDGKEVGRNSKDVRSPGVKGGKQPGKKLDTGDKGQTVKAASAETTRDVSATATSKKDVTKSAAADTNILNPIAMVATVLDSDNTTSSVQVPDFKVTDVGGEVVPKSKEGNIKEDEIFAPEATPPGTTDLETAGVRQTPKLSSRELIKDVAATSAVAAEEGQVKGLGKEEGVKQMPELFCKELMEGVAAGSAVTDEEGQVTGHGIEKPDEKDSDMSKAKKSDTKKGGWGWNSIGSWGSNVLNQVGDSFYHVLETVESSLVEPEETGSTSNDNLVQQPKEKENISDIVQLQPEKVSIDTSGGSTPLIQPETQDINEEKQGTSVAAASSENQGASLAAADAPLLGKKHDEAGGKSDPVDATDIQKEKKKSCSSKGQSSPEQSWFSGWGLSTITGAVQKTGKKVVSTGLDVLENISKSMNLTDEPEEGVIPLSPSSSGSSPSSSPKKKNKSARKGREKGKAEMLRKCFDDCQGLAHFEALTDLSQVSQEKLDKQVGKLSGDHLVAIKTDLALIRDASDLGGMDWEASFGSTEHDFCQLVKDFVSQLSLSVSLQKLFTVQENTTKWLASCLQDNVRDKKYLAEDIHKMAILMLADFTATGIAHFHKIAQLLLVDFATPLLSYKFRALSLAGLTKVLCTEIWIEARLFTECLSQLESMESGDMVMSLITNLTLEASNCSSCLQDGYHLLLPVIQLAALKIHPLTTDNADIPNLEVLQMTSSMSQSKVAKILNRLSGDDQQAVKNELSRVESAFDHSFVASEMEDDRYDQDFSLHILESLHVIGVDVTAQKLLQKQCVRTKQGWRLNKWPDSKRTAVVVFKPLPSILSLSDHTCEEFLQILAQLRTRQWLTTCEQDQQNATNTSAKDIHQRALQSLNDLTLCSVELFHQIAQVVLLENPREVAAYAKRAEGIKGLARAVCLEVGFQSSKFTKCLTEAAAGGKKADRPAQADSAADSGVSDCITPFITNVYLEASNSTTYIQDGFQLLLPIIQLALVKALPACALISD